MCERGLQRALQFAGTLDPPAGYAHCPRHRGKVQVDQLAAGIQQAGGLHFQLDEAQRAVVEHDDFDRQPELAEGDEVTHHHGEAAIARERDHLPARMAGLRADGLQQRIGHGAVVERAQQATLAVELQIAGGPHGRRADIAGEDRIVGGQFADQAVELLRVDDVPLRVDLRQRVEFGAGLGVMGQRCIEVVRIGLGGDVRHAVAARRGAGRPGCRARSACDCPATPGWRSIWITRAPSG